MVEDKGGDRRLDDGNDVVINHCPVKERVDDALRLVDVLGIDKIKDVLRLLLAVGIDRLLDLHLEEAFAELSCVDLVVRSGCDGKDLRLGIIFAEDLKCCFFSIAKGGGVGDESCSYSLDHAILVLGDDAGFYLVIVAEGCCDKFSHKKSVLNYIEDLKHIL